MWDCFTFLAMQKCKLGASGLSCYGSYHGIIMNCCLLCRCIVAGAIQLLVGGLLLECALLSLQEVSLLVAVVATLSPELLQLHDNPDNKLLTWLL